MKEIGDRSIHEYFLLKVDTGKAFCIDYLGIHLLGIKSRDMLL
jgi:hypothetical protein